MMYSRRLVVLFIAALLVLLGSLAAMFWIGLVSFRELKNIGIRGDVISTLRATQAALTEVESTQRAYLFTGDSKYFALYNGSTANLDAPREHLRELAGRKDIDPADAGQIDSLIHNRLAEMRQAALARKSDGVDAAMPIFKANAEKGTADSLHKLLSRIESQESSLRIEELNTVTRTVRARVRIFWFLFIINPVILIYAFLRIRKEAMNRQLAALDVQRQKDFLAVTLASIGDAVIVTDPSGQITYVNPVAEKLTGWRISEAHGQPCSTVFNIICEDTRQPAENPIDRVLREGVTVGLANHTLLIRRDGIEVPIDDSGAPIRETDGTIRGVVLIFRDFSERKDAERKLLTAKLAVEAASKSKDQFLARLSHELRTPLTPVLATLTSWEITGDVPENLREDVELLRRNIELEARLIDDLLDLTRIERGKMSLNPQVEDVHALVEVALRVCEPDIEHKKLEVSLDLPASRHHAQVDSARMQQVFWNVLKNATKFTAEKGHIKIISKNIGDRLEITFADDGIGMSKEIIDRLFLPFEQGGNITRQFGGLGLGMAISKAIVEAHGGAISAASAGEGRGSSFTISIPTVPAPAAPLDPRDTGASSETSRRLKILLVEDHADTAAVIDRLLRGMGHQVAVGQTVAAANKLAGSESFDLLLSDIGLPDGSGIDVIQQIRQRAQTPAIAMTGYGMEEDIARCRAAGFNAHLTKPVSFEKLRSLITEVT